ncbi:MAG: serine/threonine protein kinase [Planctomycetaceae bacterium]|nr:serine/threonine protein kinase [Planctomycetaceae bacterium]
MSHNDPETNLLDPTRAFAFDGEGLLPPDSLPIIQLNDRYNEIITQDVVDWTIRYRLLNRLGAGGQGVVYLTDREGAFGANFRLALKFHRPEGYPTEAAYRQEMSRMARIAMEVARMQQDHLLDVYNVLEVDGILVLVSEWVDGFDIRQLLSSRTLMYLKGHVSKERWKEVNDVVLTKAGFQSRFKVGVAISIIRECLAGLAALHREGMVHADIKPSNVMVKRSGNCKLIDLGSAYHLDELPTRPLWTPRYAAVEVHLESKHTFTSDLASLGYVFFEMITGRYPFAGAAEGDELVDVKVDLWENLPELLPEDLARNETLVNLLRKMIAPHPADRFASAEEADHSTEGAAEIHRQLIQMGLASEYPNDLRVLMQELGPGPGFE